MSVHHVLLLLSLFALTITQQTAPTARKADHELLGNFFSLAGSSGVPAMHAALMANGDVMFLDKVEATTQLRLSNGHYAYSSVWSPTTRQLRPLGLSTNAFCAAGSFLADGRLLSVGGNINIVFDDSVGAGYDAIRYLDANAASAAWVEPGNKLASNRWYATTQTLADGSVLVASGSLTGTEAFNDSNNNPTYEVLNKDGITNGWNVVMDILVKNQPYWMYPFIHLLNDGNIFIFVDRSSQIFNVPTNRVVKEMPDLPGMHRTYPNTGGSVLLPLRPEENYTEEVMVCGGGAWNGIDSPCDPSCGRIRLRDANPQWQMTAMPEGRGMVEGVLLLDGTVLWTNGVQRGAEGFGLADTPAFEALIYNPLNNTWTVAGTSNIPRLYHSVALMLLDGTVLIAGSNPNDMPIALNETEPGNQYRAFPTDYRVEIWSPPYLHGPRPTNVTVSNSTLRSEELFEIEFVTTEEPHSLEIVLYHGGFVTHALHMGQRMVYVEYGGARATVNGKQTVVARLPPTVALAPGPYVLYVILNGVPAVGKTVMVEAMVGAQGMPEHS